MYAKRKFSSEFIFHFVIIAVGIAMIYPILWTVASSLKPKTEIFQNVTSLIPSKLMWENYVEGWAGFGGYTFGTFFLNTTIITSATLIGTLFSTTLISFGFARLQFRFKRTLFTILLATMMLPSQVTLIPQYIIFHKLGWVNTFYPLTIGAFIGGNAFFIFLLVQFIKGIPRELDEAAVIDGAGPFGIFWRIILPLTKPALATISIFCFMWTWDDFMGPLIYLNEASKFTVSLGLRMFSDPSGITNWGSLFAISVLSILPIFLVFIFFQKYLVEGIATTGIK
ncbi:carbohydrate ABC transporter permease [Lederbergia panacisoli]|uniref:carbohydrate ABC transporter permease n=1 Tax=Lederbergia panacisoli TaxID=1255251 RepID=UPI00214CA854|nr:carbohydrate ABC transporter permease [Lederbergia panacisoli]MCR2821183.1 carbohydrate ABC transporter permease [Lederbergia panacisoli]